MNGLCEGMNQSMYKSKNNTKELVLAGIFIAIGYVLPMIFHLFNMGGPAFLPMHIPVLIAGMVISPALAMSVGIITPILSSFLTGMPPLYPMLPIMIVELAIYGFVTAICVRKFNLNYYVSLLIAMVAGRIGAGLVVAVLAIGFGLPMQPVPYILGAIVTGVPGLVIQLILVPAAAKIVTMMGYKTQNA